jgi:hypothetical protein
LVRPWFRRQTPLRRTAVIAGAALVLAGVVVAVAVISHRQEYSHSGPVPFSFSYPSALRRVHPRPGEYVRLEHIKVGAVIESFAVEPLRLAPYVGHPQSELPVYASDYVRRLAASEPGFLSLGDGTAVVNNRVAYYVLYRLGPPAHPVYGHDLFLLGRRAGARSGVVLVLRSTPAAGIHSALAVGTTSPLSDVLNSFKLGG